MTARPTVGVVAAVALGGAIGACLRAGVSEQLPAAVGELPVATLTVNLAGAFLLALLPASGVVRRHLLLPPFLGTGVLGGFTTLSAWSVETRELYATGHYLAAAGYLAATLVGCLLAVGLADRLSTPAERSTFDAEEGDL